jgi:hypothetical protein
MLGQEDLAITTSAGIKLHEDQGKTAMVKEPHISYLAHAVAFSNQQRRSSLASGQIKREMCDRGTPGSMQFSHSF